ncbi:hypothetical protein S40293_10642 [Stachybotrys chartarum IBT 40293]|nr:hypothetical protein S40293_10642 [Stachybotrys chartarum IBT 40293]KFA72925.1 hypothetical protein S40288_10690 [Stachybotrys chartarum IBT 40288]
MPSPSHKQRPYPTNAGTEGMPAHKTPSLLAEGQKASWCRRGAAAEPNQQGNLAGVEMQNSLWLVLDGFSLFRSAGLRSEAIATFSADGRLLSTDSVDPVPMLEPN